MANKRHEKSPSLGLQEIVDTLSSVYWHLSHQTDVLGSVPIVFYQDDEGTHYIDLQILVKAMDRFLSVLETHDQLLEPKTKTHDPDVKYPYLDETRESK